MSLPNDFFRRLSAVAPRSLRYREEAGEPFAAWSAAVRARLAELLRLQDGVMTASGVVESRETVDGLVRERVVIDDPLFGKIPAYLLLPPGPPAPGVLCLHGHGGYYAGKDMVAGITDTDPMALECAAALNYQYGVQMARAGFVALCPDAFNFGERLFSRDRWTKDDVCDRYFKALAPYGLSPAGISTHGNRCAVGYLLARPEVCRTQVGCVGLSFGGFQTLLLALTDDRVAAAVISGSLYSTCGAHEGGTDGCGSQVIPGLYEWCDMDDLYIALAPRPVLYEMMTQDCCTPFEESLAIYQRIAGVYTALGMPEKVMHDVAETDHRYIGTRVPEFFARHLACPSL